MTGLLRWLALFVWTRGHSEAPDGASYCRWCGLETRHVKADTDVFTGETVFVRNAGCPIYRAGVLAVRLGLEAEHERVADPAALAVSHG